MRRPRPWSRRPPSPARAGDHDPKLIDNGFQGRRRMKSYIPCAAALSCLLSAAALAADDGKYANFDGVKIHYIDRGRGEPIVLLHGGTSNLESWIRTGVVADLQTDFRVIAFDARGAGKSDKPRDPKAYGRQQTLDVPRLLDHFKLDRAHIVGYSLGASTVAQLLTLHPERFLTATLGASAGRSPQILDDPLYEVEASEIEKNCISRSRIFRLAPPNAKPTEEVYRKREEQCRADKNFDQYAVAASIRGYRD